MSVSLKISLDRVLFIVYTNFFYSLEYSTTWSLSLNFGLKVTFLFKFLGLVIVVIYDYVICELIIERGDNGSDDDDNDFNDNVLTRVAEPDPGGVVPDQDPVIKTRLDPDSDPVFKILFRSEH